MIEKRRVASMLLAGVGTSEIATALACDDSYISQLREDPEVLQLMDAERGKNSVANMEFDDQLDRTEAKALAIIERNIGFANPVTALKTFQVLNGATRRKHQGQQADHTAVNVTLVLPQAVITQYVTNERREIIEVEGRTMLSATPSSIEALAEARAGRNAKNIPLVTAVEQAAARLGALGPVPARAPRKSPLPVSSGSLRNVTVDQL